MKKTLYIFILFLLSRQSFGQTNLVPNPSFEDTIQCPVSINQPITTTYWSSYMDTPDYYNSCSNVSGSGVSVPSNMAGYQQAATGNAYCGLVTYINPSLGTNMREYIGTQLTSPLVIGTKYYVSFKTCLAGGSWFDFNIASNKIGVKFITYNFPNLAGPSVFNSAHVYTNSIITDSINWTTTKGSFVADSNYTQILCGNFFNDVNTSTISVGSPNTMSYYLIDDVCVSTDSLTQITAINEFSFIKNFAIYPNPTSDYISIKLLNHLQIHSLNLFDKYGQTIFVKNPVSPDKIDLTGISDGLYFIEIISDGKSFFEKLIVRH